MPAAIQCRDLRKTYDGKVEAVRGLNLEIQAGECFGLLGPNGAGKTTTIEILEGLLQPTSGQVTILGHAWETHTRELREWLGISLQETRLSEKLSVRETIELFASFYLQPRSSGEVLEELQLTEKADAWDGKLSGGQRQRLAVATALVGNPKILFLDEPTTGLDPQSRRQLWEIVRTFLRQGGTLLLTTHFMDEAERLCDRLAIIDHGRKIAEGSPRELVGTYIEAEVVEVYGDGAVAWMQGLGDKAARLARRIEQSGETVFCYTHDATLLLDELAHRHDLRHLKRPANLEDVFIKMTGR